MQGRIETDMKLKYKIERMIENQPLIVKQYVNSLSQHTWNTKMTYANAVICFLRWVQERKSVIRITPDVLRRLLPLDINAYMSELQYIEDKDGNIRASSSARQMKVWSILHSFFEFMVLNNFAEHNIVDKTKRPKNKDKASSEYLNEAQMRELMKSVEKTKIQGSRGDDIQIRNLLIIKLFLTTGIRVEPLREINIEDIDFRNKTVITINKGHKTQEYQLMDSVMETLMEWLKRRAKIMGVDEQNQTGALLVSTNQTRLSYWSINKSVKFYTSKIGIDGGYSCHKLRHSFGTVIYMATKDINYTKEKLGHADISTTLRYINEVDNGLDKVVYKKLNGIVK